MSFPPESEKNQKIYFENNIKKTKTFIDICAKNNIKKFIFLSSSNVYNFNPNNVKAASESQKNNPINYYGKTKSIIEKYELTAKMNILTKYLSHGQQKRVALMKAMINDYDVWLLDEPYSGLDQAGEEILDNILLDHIENSGVVVITNHKEIKKEKINIKNYKIE